MPAAEPESRKGPGVGSGTPLPTPSVRYDPDSSSWKTSGPSLLGDLDLMPSLLRLPASGTTRSGHVYERPMLAPPTSASGGSASPGLPTPRARDSKGRGYDDALPNVVELLPTPTTSESTGVGDLEGNRNDTLRAQIAMLPTPRASARENRQTKRSPTQKAGKHGLCLAAEMSELSQDSSRPSPAALLPTPRATDGTNGGPNQRGSSGDLMLPSAVVRLLPTPTVADSRGTRNATAHRKEEPKPTTNIAWTLTDVFWTGDSTAQPLCAGNTSSDAPHPLQLTIEDALQPPSSNG